MKNQDKMFMAKDMGHFGDSRAPSWLSGPQIDVPTELPSHRPCFSIRFWYCSYNVVYFVFILLLQFWRDRKKKNALFEKCEKECTLSGHIYLIEFF
jgi:hypothetical protein